MAWVSKSGAKSSFEMPRYDLIYWRVMRVLADRLGYGAEKHGDPHNYRLGVNDADYFRDRTNHLTEHALKLGEAITADDREKQIAAILANCQILLWLNDHSVFEEPAKQPAKHPQTFEDVVGGLAVALNRGRPQGDGDAGESFIGAEPV